MFFGCVLVLFLGSGCVSYHRAYDYLPKEAEKGWVWFHVNEGGVIVNDWNNSGEYSIPVVLETDAIIAKLPGVHQFFYRPTGNIVQGGAAKSVEVAVETNKITAVQIIINYNQIREYPVPRGTAYEYDIWLTARVSPATNKEALTKHFEDSVWIYNNSYF